MDKNHFMSGNVWVPQTAKKLWYAGVIIPSNPISFMYKLCPAGDEGRGDAHKLSPRPRHTWSSQLPVVTLDWTEVWSPIRIVGLRDRGPTDTRRSEGEQTEGEGERERVCEEMLESETVGKRWRLNVGLVCTYSWVGGGFALGWGGWQNDDGGRSEPKAVFLRWEGLID